MRNPSSRQAEEIRRVREALGQSRVVTLTAGGGTGKTRLATAVGEEVLPHRPDGIWFVDLTPVSDGELVPATVVAGLKLRLMSGDATAQILDYLSDKDLLLIVDNCEHLIDETADLAEQFAARPGASTCSQRAARG
jgi:predicted ATPase